MIIKESIMSYEFNDSLEKLRVINKTIKDFERGDQTDLTYMSNTVRLGVTLLKRKYHVRFDRDVLRSVNRYIASGEIQKAKEALIVLFDPIVIDCSNIEDLYVRRQIDLFRETEKRIYNRKRKSNTQSHFENMSYFNGDISKWDVGNITNLSSMFKHMSQREDTYSLEELADEVKKRDKENFLELKILKEREWRTWKDEVMSSKIRFLEFTWGIDMESLAMLRIRLMISKGTELYRTGIIDSIGKTHFPVRISEMKQLYDYLVQVRNERLKLIEDKWNEIQNAEVSSDLPNLPREGITKTQPDPTRILELKERTQSFRSLSDVKL